MTRNSAFRKDTLRSIRSSLGRFIAIAGIVALGCGFYAGLRMTGPDMRLSADEFYDSTNLYDVKMVSTLGFTDAQLPMIEEVDGVESIAVSKTTDVMASLNGDQYAMRVSSFDPQESKDGSGLNSLILADGGWPSKPGECILSADRVMGKPIKIGDTVTVLYGARDLDGVLAKREFTVVGLAHSSSFVSSVTLGSTSLGSGSIEQFVYVTEDTFDGEFPYSEVFVSVNGAKEELNGSEAYKSKIDAVEKKLKAISDEIAVSRFGEIFEESSEKLNSAQDNLDSKRDEADAELATAQAKLDSALAQLKDGKIQLLEGEKEYQSGVSQYEQSKADAACQLDEAAALFDSMQAQIDSSRVELDTKKAELDASLNAYQSQKAMLDSDYAQIETGLMQVDAGLQSIQNSIEEIDAQLELLDPASPEYAELQTAKADLTTQRSSLASQKDDLEKKKAQVLSGLSQLEMVKSQIDESMMAVDAGYASIADSQALVDAGRKELSSEAALTQEKLANALQKLQNAKQTLEDSRIKLLVGEGEYQTGLSEFQASKESAYQQLEEAQSKIDEGREELDDLEKPSIFVLDRSQNYGAESFRSDSERMDNISRVFPFIFFLVAALVSLTTMTRMVEEERILIGTYKALGYSKSTIVSKYIAYAASASLIGSVLGVLVLSQVLPYTIQYAYSIIDNVPLLPFPLPLNVPIVCQSIALGVGVTVIATWAAVAATLREQPASLMLPRAPKAGKRILLERVGFIWKRLSFSWKVTFRNIFRYKKRFWMTIIGIAGCTALLLTGLGLHDAIWDIIDRQFGPVVEYNAIIGLQDDSDQDDLSSLVSLLNSSDEIHDIAIAQRENMQVSSDSHDTMDVVVCVPEKIEAFSKLVHFKDRLSQDPVKFDEDSVVITEKMAKQLGVKSGDVVTIFDQDEIGNPVGKGYDLQISGVAEYYVGHGIFIGERAWKSATGKLVSSDSIYGITTEDQRVRDSFAQTLREMNQVETVTFNDETIDSYRKMLRSVNMIVFVLIIAAAALAFIVLYNLTNINITERRREIASLRVLGFTRSEVNSYIFREIAILTLVGAAFGLLLGIFMEGFVVATAEVDYVMFGRVIHAMSFVLAFVLTFGFSWVVMLFMRRKLASVNMVESLKSVD